MDSKKKDCAFKKEDQMVSLEADPNKILKATETEEPNEDEEIEDEEDESVAPVRYRITSFGVDFDVEGLYRRISRGEIVIPNFQRSYVWNIRQASRFIESLLLGLPVPEIFLSRDFDSDKYVVIDGQQRLRSIQFFYDGVFSPPTAPDTSAAFKLTGVQKEFEGKTFEELGRNDKFRFDNSLIHATVVKQDVPAKDNTSVYHIFDRINSSGTRLTPQEMRSAIYHGKLIDKLSVLNDNPVWRCIFGRVSRRQKDQELILRFLAFYFDSDNYKPPMTEFLTKFVGKNRNPQDTFLENASHVFASTMAAFEGALGRNAFRPDRALNVAVFDSMSVALARRIASMELDPNPDDIRKIHRDLLKDTDYVDAVSRRTANEQSVKKRMNKAAEHFSSL